MVNTSDPTLTRQRILIAAAQEMLAAGYAGASLSGMARRQGVTKGAFGYHFPTKRSLLEAVLSHHEEAVDWAYGSSRADYPDSPMHACVRMNFKLEQLRMTDPVVSSAQTLLLDPSVPVQVLRPMRTHLTDYLAELLEEAEAREGYEFTLRIADVVEALMAVLAGTLATLRFSATNDEDRMRFSVLVLRGLGVHDADQVMAEVRRDECPSRRFQTP